MPGNGTIPHPQLHTMPGTLCSIPSPVYTPPSPPLLTTASSSLNPLTDIARSSSSCPHPNPHLPSLPTPFPPLHHLPLLLLLLHSLVPAHTTATTPPAQIKCDVVVAGGSTAALATALTAATAAPNLTVCLTEPSAFLGGQLLSVPAIDFGEYNRRPENQARSFRELVAAVQRPAGCWVSVACFYAPDLQTAFIRPRLAALPNLRVFFNTTIRAAATTHSRSSTTDADAGTDGAGVAITSLTAVQRFARSPEAAAQPLSQALADWYSPTNSSFFDKRVLELTAPVFVEATEYGDVLATASLPFAQGTEQPAEDSHTTNDQCGQAATVTFFMTYLQQAPAQPPLVPPGSGEGLPFADPSRHPSCPGKNHPNCSVPSVWTYRRGVLGPGGSSGVDDINVGDTTQQNWGGGNDLDNMYPFTPLSAVRADVAGGRWAGGVNTTVLAALEQRAYGWYHAYKAFAGPEVGARMVLNASAALMPNGLSLPYLRDTRRSIGLGGFRLMHAAQAPGPNQTVQGYVFPDRVALGNYDADDHNIATASCSKPPYMTDYRDMLPFFVPFRALTNQNASNLLVAGKTLAQTFYANAASRLHPTEWTTGVAAGAAAVLMRWRGWTSTADVLAHVGELQAFLNSSTIGQPLAWTGLPAAPRTYACGLGRCLAVSTGGTHTNSTCSGACAPLAAAEWLAYGEFWAPDAAGTSIRATVATVLKKSTFSASSLPASDKRSVAQGTVCTLTAAGAAQFQNYYLCHL